MEMHCTHEQVAVRNSRISCIQLQWYLKDA